MHPEKRIAIYSGTFDPLHRGHEAVARYVALSGRVDEVWLLPSPLNPLKVDSAPRVSDAERLEMARLFAESLPEDIPLKVSDIEMRLPRPSYTYTTLCALREENPGTRFLQIVGADNLANFHKWANHRKIIDEFGLIVYPRKGYDTTGTAHPNIHILEDAPEIDVSSTQIRLGIEKGEDVSHLLPVIVYEYIKAHKLYNYGQRASDPPCGPRQ